MNFINIVTRFRRFNNLNNIFRNKKIWGDYYVTKKNESVNKSVNKSVDKSVDKIDFSKEGFPWE